MAVIPPRQTGGMVIVVLVSLLAFGVGIAVGVVLEQRRRGALASDLDAERRQILSAAVAVMRQERADAGQAALDTAISVASSKLGDQLHLGKQVIDRERGSVAEQVGLLQHELRRVGDLVSSLQRERAEQHGRLTTGLDAAMAVTQSLATTTDSLRQALASPATRGQWGERMAADVLRAAGFLEGVNYARQRTDTGGTIPDYTFFLPKGHLVHMDVKFPIDNYLRALDATDPTERERCTRQFARDVRRRIDELSSRHYIDAASTVDYVLAFIPNESVYGFVHDNDPGLIDHALAQKVVLCSPTSLFAVLAVIREAVDAFLVERRSDEILAAVASVREQWQKFGDSIDKAHRGLQSAQVALDDLRGPRSRQFERQLDQLEAVRDRRLLTESAEPLTPSGVLHLDRPSIPFVERRVAAGATELPPEAGEIVG